MRDKLDALSDLLIKLSRVPGLGFLQDQASSLTRLKHTVEGHLSEIETKKQGIEEGAGVIGGVVRPKRAEATGKPAEVSEQRPPAGGKAPSGETVTTRGQASRDKAAQDKKSQQKMDLMAKRKLAMQKLKR